ncbi:MAG: hypothetical protein H5U40_03465 [Polyangiaceae bacterium]|nr:hypothetical protein [Polyangiaceae bacterium]
MFLRKAALRPVPTYAVVDAHFIETIESTLDDDGELQERLDVGYRELDRRQPTLSGWLSAELSSGRDEIVQSLGYFLIITVFMAFREAFPKRLREIDEGALHMAIDTLAVDEELRANDPTEILESDDIIAMGQPSMISFVQHHVNEAIEQSEGELNLEELDRIYRAVLVQVIALSHAVASPSGVLGPAPETLH